MNSKWEILAHKIPLYRKVYTVDPHFLKHAGFCFLCFVFIFQEQIIEKDANPSSHLQNNGTTDGDGMGTRTSWYGILQLWGGIRWGAWFGFIHSFQRYILLTTPVPDSELGKGGMRVPKTHNNFMNKRISDCAKCQEENKQGQRLTQGI